MIVLQAFTNVSCTPELKAELCKAYTYCAVEALGVSIEQVCVFLVDAPVENAWLGGHAKDSVMLLQVYMARGRTDNQRQILLEALAAATAALTRVRPANVRVLLHDMVKADMALPEVQSGSLGAA